jgi:hypothetical protein
MSEIDEAVGHGPGRLAGPPAPEALPQGAGWS